MNRRFAIGDIHGAHKALVQCLQKAKVDPLKDLVISLGDICDGWPEVDKVIDELLAIKHLKIIRGNHDAWALEWMREGWEEEVWTKQGGEATMAAYGNDAKKVPVPHKKLFESANFFLELDNKLFVHGGIDPKVKISEQDPEVFLWDRELLQQAVQKNDPEHRFGPWDDIFLGHTPTLNYKSLVPLHACNVWALDTGAGWSGKLTIMDIDSHEYWQSDFVPDLYPHIRGRR